MKPWERWTFGLLSLLVSSTGAAYFVMKYAMDADDPFAVVNHPWQSTMLELHVLASPLLILVFGIVLNGHILRKVRARNVPNRMTGLTSLVTFGLMVASGYLLEVTTDETLIRLLVWTHVTSGIVFSMAYVVHLVISVRLARHAAWAKVREVA